MHPLQKKKNSFPPAAAQGPQALAFSRNCPWLKKATLPKCPLLPRAACIQCLVNVGLYGLSSSPNLSQLQKAIPAPESNFFLCLILLLPPFSFYGCWFQEPCIYDEFPGARSNDHIFQLAKEAKTLQKHCVLRPQRFLGNIVSKVWGYRGALWERVFGSHSAHVHTPVLWSALSGLRGARSQHRWVCAVAEPARPRPG